MSIQVITAEDLEKLKTEIFLELKQLIENLNVVEVEKDLDQIYLRSPKVEKLLHLSASKLQSMRLSGQLPYIKIGGVLFYDKNDIIKVLEMHKRNPH